MGRVQDRFFGIHVFVWKAICLYLPCPSIEAVDIFDQKISFWRGVIYYTLLRLSSQRFNFMKKKQEQAGHFVQNMTTFFLSIIVALISELVSLTMDNYDHYHSMLVVFGPPMHR